MNTHSEKTRPIEVLVNVKIKIEAASSITHGNADKATRLVEWAAELKRFLDELTGLGCAHVNVILETEEQCSHCHSAWDTYTQRGNLCCAACGREVESE